MIFFKTEIPVLGGGFLRTLCPNLRVQVKFLRKLVCRYVRNAPPDSACSQAARRRNFRK
jgi:hypothetical protein